MLGAIHVKYCIQSDFFLDLEKMIKSESIHAGGVNWCLKSRKIFLLKKTTNRWMLRWMKYLMTSQLLLAEKLVKYWALQTKAVQPLHVSFAICDHNFIINDNRQLYFVYIFFVLAICWRFIQSGNEIENRTVRCIKTVEFPIQQNG